MGNISEYKNYHATMCGKIFNTDTKKELKPNKVSNSYHMIKLYKNGVQKSFLVHRLVCMAYKKNDNVLRKDVNHIDGNKGNNKINNLEWCTKSENMYHALNNKLLIPKNKGNHYKAKMVLDLNNGIFYDSIIEFCEARNLKNYTIKNNIKYKNVKRNYIIL